MKITKCDLCVNFDSAIIAAPCYLAIETERGLIYLRKHSNLGMRSIGYIAGVPCRLIIFTSAFVLWIYGIAKRILMSIIWVATGGCLLEKICPCPYKYLGMYVESLDRIHNTFDTVSMKIVFNTPFVVYNVPVANDAPVINVALRMYEKQQNEIRKNAQQGDLEELQVTKNGDLQATLDGMFIHKLQNNGK